MPLSQRKNDILPLAHHFLQQSCYLLNKQIEQLSTLANDKLLENHWPGNVRQLRNTMFIAVNNCGNEVMLPDDLVIVPPHNDNDMEINNYSNGLSVMSINPIQSDGEIKPLKDMEQEIIDYALQHYSGSRTKTAKNLGIGRTTLYRKANLMDCGS